MAVGRDYLGSYRLVRLIRVGHTCQIWEAIDEGAWGEIEGYERELAAAFERAGSLADEVARVLELQD